jgi:hypothetical protein
MSSKLGGAPAMVVATEMARRPLPWLEQRRQLVKEVEQITAEL